MTSRANLFSRVYEAAQTEIRGVLQPMLDTLAAMGCGPNKDFETFDDTLRRVLVAFAHGAPGEPQFQQLRITPSAKIRRTMISDFVFSLGHDRDDADRVAARATKLSASALRAHVPAQTRAGRRHSFSHDVRRVFRSGVELHERLTEMKSDSTRPYSGDASAYGGPAMFKPSGSTFAERGIDQTVDVVRTFPELADRIYRRARLTNLESFPPKLRQGRSFTPDEREFVAHVEEELSSDARWEMVSVVALIAGGIILTVVTAGMAGVVAGMAVGAGVGLAQGGLQVYEAQSELSVATDAARMGAGSETRVAFLEGELQGAWGMLMVDVATGGILGRFGGAGNISKVAQTLRTSTISGTGAGVGAAMNPNVWASQDTVGILLKASIVGGVTGGASSLIGQKIMIGLSKKTRTLKPGARVTLAARGADAPTEGRVVRVEGNRVVIETLHGRADYVIDGAAVVKNKGPFQPYKPPSQAPQLGGMNARLGVNTVLNPVIPDTIHRAAARGRLGTPVDPREAVIMRLGKPGRPWTPTTRPNDREFGTRLAEIIDELGSKMRGDNPISFEGAMALATKRYRATTKDMSRDGGRADNTGVLRDLPGTTPLDPKHARLAERRHAPAVDDREYHVAAIEGRLPPGPSKTHLVREQTTDFLTRKPRSRLLWEHQQPNAEASEAASAAYHRVLQASHPAEIIDAAARFHYRFAHWMPHERGSAGIADALTRALLHSRGIQPGAWRRNIAPDRRAMVMSEADFVRGYPSFFAVNDPPGLF